MITNLHKRYLLFLLGCIPARILLTYLARNKVLLIEYITLVIGFGFLYIYFTGSRKTGREVFGDLIWWNKLRIIHGLLYLLFSILTITKTTDSAWVILALDTLIGFVAFMNFHFYKASSITKLIII